MVAARCGHRTDIDEQIDLELSLVQRTILEDGRIKPWWLRKLDQTLTLTANSRTVALPSDFIEFYQEGGLWHYDGTAGVNARYVRKLKESSLASLVNLYQEEAGDPQGYTYDKTKLLIFPKAGSSDVSLRISYIAREIDIADLAEDGSNKWITFAQDLFVAETLIRMAPRLRDQGLLQIAQAEAAEARGRLHAATVSLEMSDADHQIGGDD